MFHVATAIYGSVKDDARAAGRSVIESGRGEGMQLMDDAIMQRYKEGAISAQTAYLYAFQKARFESLQRPLA